MIRVLTGLIDCQRQLLGHRLTCRHIERDVQF